MNAEKIEVGQEKENRNKQTKSQKNKKWQSVI
jgi:hypothetical protein